MVKTNLYMWLMERELAILMAPQQAGYFVHMPVQCDRPVYGFSALLQCS